MLSVSLVSRFRWYAWQLTYLVKGTLKSIFQGTNAVSTAGAPAPTTGGAYGIDTLPTPRMGHLPHTSIPPTVRNMVHALNLLPIILTQTRVHKYLSIVDILPTTVTTLLPDRRSHVAVIGYYCPPPRNLGLGTRTTLTMVNPSTPKPTELRKRND